MAYVKAGRTWEGGDPGGELRRADTRSVAGPAASHRLMKAPQNASPAPVVSRVSAGYAAMRTGASHGTASTHPAPGLW